MKNIDKLLSVYLDKENKAAQRLMECRNAYQQQLRLLEELRQYEKDYKGSFSHIAMAGVKIEKIQNFNLFIGKLRKIIKNQIENVNIEKKKLEHATLQWQEKRLERKTLDKLDEKNLLNQRLSQAKKEQKQVDEIAMQLHRRREEYD
jgi:flagellar protein FliJ